MLFYSIPVNILGGVFVPLTFSGKILEVLLCLYGSNEEFEEFRSNDFILVFQKCCHMVCWLV